MCPLTCDDEKLRSDGWLYGIDQMQSPPYTQNQLTLDNLDVLI